MRNLSAHWDGSGWDAHSCVWPAVGCAALPAHVALSARLRTLAPPHSFPRGDGARVSGDASALLRLLQGGADVLHVAAFNACASW